MTLRPFAFRWFGWRSIDCLPFLYRSHGGWSLYLGGLCTITLRVKRGRR